MASEDFLYHLSRGSELLKENLVEDAKEALELALRLQPRDLRGQGLLGVVYFRLGLYPRAIDIYRQIVEACASDVTPKVNLALCYVKTGQHHAARELLEAVVQSHPEHLRAWAYLGLVLQFQREFTKAEVAFERAGQRGMAERMRQLAEQNEPLLDEPPIGPERWELRAAAEDAFGEIESKTSPFRVDTSAARDHVTPQLGRWTATEPGEETIPNPDRSPRRASTPPPSPRSSPVRPPSFRPPPLPSLNAEDWSSDEISSAPTRLMGQAAVVAARETGHVHLREWLEQRLPSGSESPVAQIDARTLRVELREPFAVRANTVMIVTPSEVARREIRVAARLRSIEQPEPLGGTQAPIVGFSGPGTLLARAPTGIVELIELDAETLTVRQSVLFGLALGLRHESERVRFGNNEALDVVRLSGRGIVALNLSSEAMTLGVAPGGLVVRLAELVGWTARALPEPIDPAEAPGRARGFVALTGEGTAIVL